MKRKEKKKKINIDLVVLPSHNIRNLLDFCITNGHLLICDR